MILPDFIAGSFQLRSKVDSSGDLCLKGRTNQYRVCDTRMKKERIRFCHLDWSEKELYKGVVASVRMCLELSRFRRRETTPLREMPKAR